MSKEFKSRFELDGNIFRIVRTFSYGISYEAFCKGIVDMNSLIGKRVELQDYSNPNHTTEYKVISASNRIMPYYKEKTVQRTYITICMESDLYRQILFFAQRDWRGFDSSEMWSLDTKLLEIIIPRLKRFSIDAEGHGWPDGLNKDGSIKYVDCGEIIGKIIKGFELIQRDTVKYTKQESDCINRAFNLFKIYFNDLWT